MRKFFTFLFALAASLGMMNAKVTWDSSNMSSFAVSETDQPYTLEGVTLSTNASLVMAYCDGYGDEIHFVSYETGGFTFSNTLGKNFTKIEMFLTSSGGWGNANLGSGWSFMNNGPVTWTGNASTVDLLKDEDDFGGASVKIVFYFEGDSQEPDPVGPVADLSKDIEIDLRGQQLGGDSKTGGSKYLIIDSEDNYTYVDDEPAAYNAHFAFDNFNGTQHGYTNLLVTVPVKAGKYRLTLGTCQFGTGTGNVKNASSEILAEFDQKTAACYNGNPAQNTVSVIFTVDAAQTITIDCGNWTPYMKLEAVTAYQVSFALGDAEGTAPATLDVTIGEDITMPVNKTMYKEGYTLTGWSDGVNTYPIGNSFTPANDVVLTPVFTANEADLLNASSDVTVKWYFGGDNGAPTTSYEGTSGLLVAQATIGDKTVDVKLSIDATSGKFAPQATTEWAQVNVGTIFTYPYKEGMTVNVGNYKSKVTYYIADAEGKVVCYYENDYYSFIQVTYPATQPTGVEDVQSDKVQATKFFRDGQLLIERDGKIFNVTGAQVR